MTESSSQYNIYPPKHNNDDTPNKIHFARPYSPGKPHHDRIQPKQQKMYAASVVDMIHVHKHPPTSPFSTNYKNTNSRNAMSVYSNCSQDNYEARNSINGSIRSFVGYQDVSHGAYSGERSCVQHPDVKIYAFCIDCGQGLCSDCQFSHLKHCVISANEYYQSYILPRSNTLQDNEGACSINVLSTEYAKVGMFSPSNSCNNKLTQSELASSSILERQSRTSQLSNATKKELFEYEMKQKVLSDDEDVEMEDCVFELVTDNSPRANMDLRDDVSFGKEEEIDELRDELMGVTPLNRKKGEHILKLESSEFTSQFGGVADLYSKEMTDILTKTLTHTLKKKESINTEESAKESEYNAIKYDISSIKFEPSHMFTRDNTKKDTEINSAHVATKGDSNLPSSDLVEFEHEKETSKITTKASNESPDRNNLAQDYVKRVKKFKTPKTKRRKTDKKFSKEREDKKSDGCKGCVVF